MGGAGTLSGQARGGGEWVRLSSRDTWGASGGPALGAERRWCEDRPFPSPPPPRPRPRLRERGDQAASLGAGRRQGSHLRRPELPRRRTLSGVAGWPPAVGPAARGALPPRGARQVALRPQAGEGWRRLVPRKPSLSTILPEWGVGSGEWGGGAPRDTEHPDVTSRAPPRGHSQGHVWESQSRWEGCGRPPAGWGSVPTGPGLPDAGRQTGRGPDRVTSLRAPSSPRPLTGTLLPEGPQVRAWRQLQPPGGPGPLLSCTLGAPGPLVPRQL